MDGYRKRGREGVGWGMEDDSQVRKPKEGWAERAKCDLYLMNIHLALWLRHWCYCSIGRAEIKGPESVLVDSCYFVSVESYSELKVNVKLSLCFNQVPCHEGILGERKSFWNRMGVVVGGGVGAHSCQLPPSSIRAWQWIKVYGGHCSRLTILKTFFLCPFYAGDFLSRIWWPHIGHHLLW
jgi:hypothetical protein